MGALQVDGTIEGSDTVLRPFASPAELQAYTKGKIKAAEPRVAPMLDAISSEIRREAGWHIWPLITEDLVLDGSGGRVQPVPSMRVERIISASSAGVTIPPEALDFSALGLLEIQGGSLWTRRYRQVLITLQHGYPAIPGELRALCLSLAARALASPLGATREQAGSLSVNWAASAGVSGSIIPSSDERATIARYKTVEA